MNAVFKQNFNNTFIDAFYIIMNMFSVDQGTILRISLMLANKHVNNSRTGRWNKAPHLLFQHRTDDIIKHLRNTINI